MDIFFTSDLHFGHEHVASVRGFADVTQHDEHIAHVWSQTVRDEDRVYVLGDISSGHADQEREALLLLQSLPGQKILIAGNHDSVSGVRSKVSPNLALFRDTFSRISDVGCIKVNKKKVALSHFPFLSQEQHNQTRPVRYEAFRLHDVGQELVHGHTHSSHVTSDSFNHREYHVGWDAHHKLVHISEIHRWVDSL